LSLMKVFGSQRFELNSKRPSEIQTAFFLGWSIYRGAVVTFTPFVVKFVLFFLKPVSVIE
jgi:hypothetical protein